MEDVFVGRLMSNPVETVAPTTSMRAAAKRMADAEIGSLLITAGDETLVGILTATDFIRHTAASDKEALVEDWMSTDLTTTTAQVNIRDVADLMVEHGFHHVPVVDTDDHVVGIITTTDLTAYLSRLQKPSPA